MKEEEEEPTSTASNDESHNTEDEPNNDDTLEEIRYQIRQYLLTEHWGDQEWNHCQQCRLHLYRHYWRAFHYNRLIHNCLRKIPFDDSDYSDV
jgi:hypothetical protein